MSVKFKIGFTIESETLFRMISQMLPVEDLSVEEVMVRQPQGIGKSVMDQLIEAPKKPKNAEHHFKHPSGKTVQDFVIEFLKTRPSATWAEMSKHTVSIGYNKSSINNAVSRLLLKKMLEKVAPGVYRLTKQARTS
jgi:hypothetical protein